MSREERLRRILGQAPPAPAPVPETPPEPRNVLDHPLRSRFLSATAAPEIKPGAIDGASLMGRALIVGPYVGAVSLALVVIVAAMLVRQTLILAEVGEATCSTLAAADLPENQIYWLDTDPDSKVPLLKARQIAACADARRLF